VPFISSFPFLSAVEFALSCVTNWICIQNSSWPCKYPFLWRGIAILGNFPSR
jgi:hypothetical protein